MLYLLFLLYLTFSYVFPGEVIPALAPLRLTYWTGITGLLVAAAWLSFKRTEPVKTLQFWCLGALTVTLALSRALGEQWFGAVVPALNQFGPSVAMFLLVICAVDSVKRIRTTSIAIVVLSLVVVLQGIAAYHFGYQSHMFLFDPVTRAEYVGSDDPADSDQTPDQRAEETPDQREEAADLDSDIDPSSTLVRIMGLGLLHDPNDLALGLAMALPLLWAGWRQNRLFRNLMLIVMPSAFLIYGVFLTRSRGGALALLVTACVALSRKIGRVTAVLLFAVFMAGGLIANFAGGRQVSLTDESVSGRVEAWSEGLQMLKENPLLGVGYGQFLEHHTLTAHNALVLCFAESGLIGYFFWFGLLFITFAQVHYLKQLPGDEPIDQQLRLWAGAIELSSIAFMTAAMFLSRTFVPMLYLLVGLGIALTLIARQAKRPVWSPSAPQFGTLVLLSEVASIVLIYVVVRLHLV